MDFFHKTERPIHVMLAQDKTRLLMRGYPWVFANEIDKANSSAKGLAILKDKSRKIIAKGLFDGSSALSFRVCALEEETLDSKLILQRLDQALKLRKKLFDKSTNGYRLLNGEGDGLPGLVCDIYDSSAVIKLDGLGPAAFWNVSNIALWLKDQLKCEQVLLKQSSRTQEQNKWLLGGGKPKVTFLENGITFCADIMEGQKTGFFFDQRDNRKRVKDLASGASVLNLFGYTGGFSVYAGAGRAQSVTTVDSAKPAIEDAKENWNLNVLPSEMHHAITSDAFEFIEKARTRKETWDIVIADPPSFASSKDSVPKATAAYTRLFEGCARITSSEGLLMASSCSSHISFEAFIDICEAAVSKARRKAQVLGVYGQPLDHPYPLACPELRYLKFVILKVGR